MPKDIPVRVTTELTGREREILRLLAASASNKDIARQLFISANTVKVHLRNIFAKIGVASRTEAAVYAIHEGMTQTSDLRTVSSATQELPIAIPAPFEKNRRRLYFWIAALVTVLSAGLLTLAVITNQSSKIPVASPAPAASSKRWQELADLPTARSGLAAAVYENQIYAISGETEAGVTSVLERYDLAANTWTGLSSKPTAVADVSAAVIGGRIYVPGGRLASGAMTNILDVYDPREDRWEQGAALPTALSAYALVAFEGKLYIFGGWDGDGFLASVYEYDPEADTWRTRAPMSSARAYSGATTAGGGIYVLGGFDGREALAVNEEYLPERNSWSPRAPLPAGRYAMGAADIADIIYVVGGVGKTDSPLLPALQYVHQQNQWQEFEAPLSGNWSHLGIIPTGTRLYILGGRLDGISTAQNLAYQAIYTILIPVIP